MSKMFDFLCAGSAAAFLGFAFTACSESPDVAGGISEETNTLAGVLTDQNGKLAARVVMTAQHVDVDTLSYADTTDEKGRFAFPLKRQGRYGISANLDSSAVYSTVEYLGQKLELELNLEETTSLEGRVVLDSSAQSGDIRISLPGTPWTVEVDSLGNFEIKDIPVGKYPIVVKSPDPARYLDAAFMVEASAKGSSISGPSPLADVYDVDFSANWNSEKGENIVQLPLSTEYGLMSWWSMDYVSVSGSQKSTGDARGKSDAVVLYGGAELVEGVSGKALALDGADQFGVVENDNGILDSVNQFTLELLLQVDSLDTKKNFRRNIMGKLGFGSSEEKDVFSLAMINGECGAKEPRLAFFLAEGSGDSLACKNAVVAADEFDFNKWNHVIVVFASGTIKMYVNGKLSGEQKVSFGRLQDSDEPIFFGKENLNLKLDDVRLGVKAITSADVLYRYNLKGGAL